MKRIIIALRIVATILLVGIVVTIVKSPSGMTPSVGVGSGFVNFGFATGSDEVYLSSALLGFIVSLVATVLSIRFVGRARKFQWPLIWAVLGILTLTNEITRLFHNHVQVLLSFPLFQVIADWLSIRFLKNAQSKREDSQPGAGVVSPANILQDEPPPQSSHERTTALGKKGPIMNEDEFWDIIEKAGSPDRLSPHAQCKQIIALLSGKSLEELVGFENIRHQLLLKSYTWPMLKACFITLSYVSDDVFEDFRHWIILNGRTRFYETIANPEAIAEYARVDDAVEELTGEPLMFVCERAWDGDAEDIMAEVEYQAPPDIADEWPPKEQLQAEFPRLFKRFWNMERIREIHGDS